MSRRRDFLSQLGLAAAAFAIDADELSAAPAPDSQSNWDTSWLDRLAKARYRVVFNGNAIDDGGVLGYASTFFDQYHEVHNTTDAETIPVVVFRRLGTPMALNDRLWDRYELGKDTNTKDSGTAARRNVFGPKIEALHKRGMISLVCNVSLGSMGQRFARQTNRDVEETQHEFRTNLVPGAIAVPSGIYALIRAQNAGCAFMPGS